MGWLCQTFLRLLGPPGCFCTPHAPSQTFVADQQFPPRVPPRAFSTIKHLISLLLRENSCPLPPPWPALPSPASLGLPPTPLPPPPPPTSPVLQTDHHLRPPRLRRLHPLQVTLKHRLLPTPPLNRLPHTCTHPRSQAASLTLLHCSFHPSLSPPCTYPLQAFISASGEMASPAPNAGPCPCPVPFPSTATITWNRRND